MKILQVSQYFYPWVKWSSTGKSAYKTTEALLKLGIEVDLLVTDCKSSVKIDRSSENIIRENSKIIVLHTPRIFEKTGLCYPARYDLLKNLVKEYDVIHVHEYMSPLNVYVISLARKYKVPYVVQPHGIVSYIYATRDTNSLYRLARLLIDRLVGFKYLNQASGLLVLSRYEEALIRSLGISTNIFVIPQAIDSNEYGNPRCSFRKKFGIGEDEFVILYLGRKAPVKGLDLLLRSLSIMLSKYNISRKIRVIIAGPHSRYEESLKNLARRLGIERYVYFIGPLFGELKVAALREANLFVLTSRYESFPIAVLEAFICRTPVLATRVGVLREKDFEDKAILTDPDPESIASKLYDIVTGKHDLDTMVKNAYFSILENFTYDKVASKLIRIYEQLLEG